MRTMLARNMLHARSNKTICPFCQARNVPSVTQIVHTKASTKMIEAIPVESVAGVKPEPAWNAVF